MDHAVLLLVSAGKLMLLDRSGSVIVSVCAYDQSVLCAALHRLCIYIVIWPVVLDEPSFFLPCLEVLDSLVICRLAVFVDYRVEIYFRLCYVEE